MKQKREVLKRVCAKEAYLWGTGDKRMGEEAQQGSGLPREGMG